MTLSDDDPEPPREASAPEPPRARTPFGQVAATLREPFFARVFSSNLIQYTAYFAQAMMLQWLVTSLTESRTVIGLVSFVQGAVIFLVSPVAGVAADRLPRRNILIGGRVGLAAVITAIGALVASGRIEIWHILVGALFSGLLTAFMQPATQTLVFDVVSRERAPNAVALNVAAQGVGLTLGPMSGGILIGAIGFVAAYFSAAAGVALAAGILLLVPVLGEGTPTHARASWLRDLKEGLRYVRGNRPVLLALLATSMAVFNGAVAAMRPVFARHVLEVDSAGYGAMAGAAGLGGLLAAFVMAGLPAARRPGLMMGWSMLGFSVGILLYSFAFSYEYILAVEFTMGIVGQIWNVYTFSGLQMAVPPEMRGRVVSLVYMLIMLAPVGALFVGLLADFAGDQIALGTFGVLPMIVLSGILLFGSGQLRKL